MVVGEITAIIAGVNAATAAIKQVAGASDDLSTLMYDLFSGLGYKTGLLSTVVNKIGKDEIPATHTTPNPVALNALLRDMVNEGCSHCFMEVSSHAIDQYRIYGLYF